MAEVSIRSEKKGLQLPALASFTKENAKKKSKELYSVYVSDCF